jgi:hypothetical protein
MRTVNTSVMHARCVMPDALQQLQLDIAAHLMADALFQYVRVVVARPRAAEDAVLIEQTINEALGGLRKYIARTAGQTDEQWQAACEASGKAGLLIIVMMSEGEVPTTGPGPALELVQVVRVIENPMINESADGTGITLEEVTLHVLGELHSWSNDGKQALRASKTAFKEVNLANGVGYDVSFTRLMPLQPRNPVSRPVITITDPQMTITCATSGAAIYFTTDGSFPSALNGTLYSGAVDVGSLAAGTVIRAVATKSPLRGSDCARAEV